MQHHDPSTLSPSTRGFLAWCAEVCGESAGVWLERFLSPMSEPGPAPTRIVDGAFVSLDLRALGPSLREALGSEAQRELPLAGLQTLRALDVTGLGLGRLDVGGLALLEVLACGSNALRTLRLDDCFALTELHAADNQLMVVDLTWLGGLEVLDLRSNVLSAVTFGEHPALRELNLSRNQLMALDVSGLGGLERLHVQRNGLHQLVLGTHARLEVLEAARNELDALTLSGCGGLRSLDLSYNRLAQVAVAGHALLERLDLSANYLDELAVGGCVGLRRLAVARNQLGALELRGCAALRELDCRRNHLRALDLVGLDQLVVLDVACNRLEALDLRGLGRLASVIVDENPLAGLTLAGNTRLTSLSVRGHALSALDLREAGRLCCLWLSPVVADLQASAAQRCALPVLRASAGLTALDAEAEPDGLDACSLHAWVLLQEGPGREEALRRAVSLPQCDRGTALLAYWTSRPRYFQRYAQASEVAVYELACFHLLMAVEERELHGGWGSDEIAFDPRDDTWTAGPEGHDWTADLPRVPKVARRAIPESLLSART